MNAKDVLTLAVIVITGASSGIGEATARVLAAEGHKLVLAARRAERLAALAAELSARTDVLVVPTDVADPEAVEALVERAVAHFGRIDVLVNNAGLRQWPRWWQSSVAEIREILETNLTAPILAERAALRHMLTQGSGQIINVGSVAGYIGTSGLYSATKFGLRGHTEALRREVGAKGIAVCLVSPGFVKTEMTRDVPFPMPPAEVVGKAIARLIRRPRRSVVVPGWYRPLIWLSKLLPGVADAAVRRFVMRV